MLSTAMTSRRLAKVFMVLSLLLCASTIQSMSLPLRQVSRTSTAVPLFTAKFRLFDATPMTPERNSRLHARKRRIIQAPTLWFDRWSKALKFSYPALGMLWFCWSLAVPRATAANTAPEHFTMEPREAFAHPPKQAESANTPSPSESTLTERQESIRSRTGTAIIFGTAVLAAARVNRSKRARTLTNDDDAPNLDPRQDLKWLFPQSAPSSMDHPEPSPMVIDTEATLVAVEEPTPPSVSSSINSNSILANAKAIASQKLQSTWLKSRSDYVPTIRSSGSRSNNPPKAISVPPNKKVVHRQQQPKAPVEEARLQAKYAAIESLEERAFTILVDLGMVESSPDALESAWQ